MATHRPPEWIDVETETEVFRFVKEPTREASAVPKNFRSDKARGKKNPTDRELEYPALLCGMSAFISDEGARDQWEEIELLHNPPGKPRKPLGFGDYIARLVLQPERGISYCLDGDGDHIILRGDETALAECVEEVYLAARNAD